MPRNNAKKQNDLTKISDVNMDRISVFFRKNVLKQILKILLMEQSGYRTFKSVKSINRLFNNLDMSKYQNNEELKAYIWCIKYVSKEWLDGVVSPEVIVEMARRQPEFTNIHENIMTECLNDPNIISAPEAKSIFALISEALQYGYVSSMKDEYIRLLDDINLDEPGAFKQLVERLFKISQSLLDIKHNTNMVANKIEFNTADIDSVKESVSSTIDSLRSNNAVFKTGIRRLNTLLSPGYMNGRIYVYLGLPGSYKSGLLLKSALDIRKYNRGFKTKTPGMRPCVLFITMENTFQETIERIWNMSFDEPMTNYSPEEATEKLCEVLGVHSVVNEETEEKKPNDLQSLLEDKEPEMNIEIVMQYYPYRSINTDDLFTIISDLRDENMEVCALVLDYIKRIEPVVPIQDNVRLELDRIMNELKALAVIQDIPVITAHQMNRAAAATVDAAARQGRSDNLKLVGRENVGDS